MFVDATGKRFIVGVIRDVSEDKVKEARLRDSLLEKEVLLKEVHHRVKNNLQTISSLLFLQKEGIEDPAIQELFDESRSRIGSMALVHEELYRSGDLGRVDAKEYLERLAPRVIQTLRGGKRLELALELVSCRLSVDKAIPLGLIVNELLTNAAKHGFHGRERGRYPAVPVRGRRNGSGRGVRTTARPCPRGFIPRQARPSACSSWSSSPGNCAGPCPSVRDGDTVFRLSFPLVDPPA